MNRTLNKYAVIGKPVFHSLSPNLFREFYKQSEIDNAKYYRITGDNLIDIVDFVKKFDFMGINVTSPFKEEILKYLDEIDKTASEIGAINTVVNYDGILKGFNTDFLAILDLIKKYKIEKNSKTLVIGAGGAAKACINALNFYGFKNITIVNRTNNKAKKLALKYGCQELDFNLIKSQINDFEFVINTTPLKLSDINKNSILLNAVYSNEIVGENIISGKEWLVLQAVYSFGIFHKKLIKEINFNYDKINKKIISFIGFSGSGKTSIGKALSDKLNFNFIDIDYEIEKRTSKSIEQIFEQDGESKFRELESDVLKEVINSENSIISCGGGIILNENNRKLLEENTTVCWIYSDLEKCLERNNYQMKPPLNENNFDKEVLLKEAEKLFEERLGIYFHISENIVINNSDEQTIVERLEDEINNMR